ncbi:MAG TPA: hypothetical protein EYG73_05075 [Arcobacter sp.]|nr:hypothetical protein [Arcobacter sp.]
MEVSIFALEHLIEENEKSITNCKKQLKEIEDGTIHVSAMKSASVENTLEVSSQSLEEYKAIYDAIPQKDKDRFKELQHVQEALAKQTYYKLQKIRLKRNLNLKRTQKLEAMMVVDELPQEVNINDPQLIEISKTIIKYNIRETLELDVALNNIKNEWQGKLSSLPDNEDLKTFAFLDTYVPIIVLHLSVLVQDIEEKIKEHNENVQKSKSKIKPIDYKGLPKFEDWWIEELFKNHQAYFGLFKWKSIIEGLCQTKQQKIIWHKVFSNWLMIKKILSNKEENSFDYNFIFDKLVEKFVRLEEELDEKNIQSMEKIVNNITSKEDFTKTKEEHDTHTLYYKWKIEKNNNS